MTEVERLILSNQQLILEALGRLLLVAQIDPAEDFKRSMRLAKAAGETRGTIEYCLNLRTPPGG